MLLNKLALLLLLFATIPSVMAQQSTTGPEPPPGTDRGRTDRGQGAGWQAESQVVIPDVPAYRWRHGCGPTALGMVIGYWAERGYSRLVDGDAGTQTAAVNAMIADDSGNSTCGGTTGDHYRDYSCPRDSAATGILPDKSETGGAHPHNCVADFMKTSWSSRGSLYGSSWLSSVPLAFTRYVNHVAPEYSPVARNVDFHHFSWSDFKNEINAGRPLVMLVDIDGDDVTDHFVMAIGYRENPREYCIHDTWDRNRHWYSWREIAVGNPWGIHSVTLCQLAGGLSPVVRLELDAAVGGTNRQGSFNVLRVSSSSCEPIELKARIAPGIPRHPVGAEGWSTGIAHDPELLQIVDDGNFPTVRGTAAEPALVGGFCRIETVDPEDNGGKGGVLSTIVLSLTEQATLDPTRPEDILHIRYRARSASFFETVVSFEDGLQGSDRTVQNELTVEGKAVSPNEFVGVKIIRQGPTEIFCNPQERNDCIPDTLEVVFKQNNSSVFEYDNFVAGTKIECEAVIDTKNATVQGWSFGIAHDDAFLALIEDSVTTEGTIVDPDHRPTVAFRPNFDVTNAVPGGWISAIVLSFGPRTELPVGTRNTIARASYTLIADPGTDGTRIGYVDEQIGAPGSPPIAINITVDGVAKLPETMVHGLVRQRATLQRAGDCTQDGAVDISDAICLWGYLFLGDPTRLPCGDGSNSHQSNKDLLDWQADGRIDVTDGVALLEFLFFSGPPHPSGNSCVLIEGCPLPPPPRG